MTLSCGVNDVWHGANGVPLDKYKVNITQMVEKCQVAGIKVMILTATMIGEDQPNANNQKLVAYNEFLRTLATEKKCLLADLNADMQAAIAKAGADKKGNLLTGDGVHMNSPWQSDDGDRRAQSLRPYNGAVGDSTEKLGGEARHTEITATN